jgi:hypothetical protein
MRAYAYAYGMIKAVVVLLCCIELRILLSGVLC